VKFFLAALAFSSTVISAQVATMPQVPVPLQATPATSGVDPNKVIVTIGDQKITVGEYENLINALPAQYQASARGAGKRAFAERIVELKILAGEAEKRKLDQEPKTKEEIAFQRDNLLAQAMFENLQNSAKVDAAAVEKYYNEHKSEFEVLKARHILIRVKGAPMQAAPGKPELSDPEALAKAQAIRKKLVAGEAFAALAKAESDDSGSAAQGGELGEFRKGMMVPPFEEAAFAAKIGEVTEPVKTPFGYHLIEVESHVVKPLPEVRADIEKKLRPALASEMVASLRKNANVTMDDSFFGPPAPAVPAAPAANGAAAPTGTPAAPAPPAAK
jgi:peptidyl-prolyl cis-trans isomerase C